MERTILSKKEFQEQYPRYNTDSKWRTLTKKIKASEYYDAYIQLSRNDISIDTVKFEKFLKFEGINWSRRYGGKPLTREEFERMEL